MADIFPLVEYSVTHRNFDEGAEEHRHAIDLRAITAIAEVPGCPNRVQLFIAENVAVMVNATYEDVKRDWVRAKRGELS